MSATHAKLFQTLIHPVLRQRISSERHQIAVITVMQKAHTATRAGEHYEKYLTKIMKFPPCNSSVFSFQQLKIPAHFFPQ